MKDARWEIACHGLKWIDHRNFGAREEQEAIDKAILWHENLTGTPPQGWYTGRSSVRTLDLIAKKGGFLYASDSYADDLPYWYEKEDKHLLIVPYTLEVNDMRFATAPGFNDGTSFFTCLKDTFDALSEEGKAGAPKMMSIGLHPRLAGRPARARALKRFLDYATAQEGIWFASRAQIAEHWNDRHPFRPRNRPSQMNREEFVRAFGDVFEHSPWVAEAAFDIERGPAHDDAFGLWSAMVFAFRSASEDEQLRVIQAHPELAGKQALGALSQSEQNAAGLRRMEQETIRDFRKMNAAYKDKFGFPFVLAVRDHRPETIADTFRKRLQRSRNDEIKAARDAVERIAWHRLSDRLPTTTIIPR